MTIKKGLYVRTENNVALGSPRTMRPLGVSSFGARAENYLAPISSSAQPGSEFSF
jgi:hypothetical protein